MDLIVLCPHFRPDTAPTGTVMTRIVEELAGQGHRVHVVTSLPWYRSHRIEHGWAGRWIRTERTGWGSITRDNPIPGADKSNLPRRALGFAGFSLLVGVAALRAGGWLGKADAVLAMSPPLTLGLTGRVVGLLRRAPLVFNVQDVFPDAAIRTGAITDPRVIRLAHALERLTYRTSAAVTVLSQGLAENVARKLPPRAADRVHVIPNFVDTSAITPGDRNTAYRAELGIGNEPVVLYAGNVGFSQSLDLVLGAARQMPDVVFVINGDGAARQTLQAGAEGLSNVRFAGYQPIERLSEVLATGDVHVVPLRRGLGDVSVPSKTYSSLAAARPVVASIDLDSEIPHLLAAAGAGVAVEPDDLDRFVDALRRVLDDPELGARMGANGRRWVEREASPTAVGATYGRLLARVAGR